MNFVSLWKIFKYYGINRVINITYNNKKGIDKSMEEKMLLKKMQQVVKQAFMMLTRISYIIIGKVYNKIKKNFKFVKGILRNGQ